MISPKKSTTKFPTLKSKLVRSSFMSIIALTPLVALTLLLLPAPETALAQNRPSMTWQEVLRNLFGRQPQRGGSRGEPEICTVTPLMGNGAPSSGLFRKPKPNLVLNQKPLIAWYGSVGAIKIRDKVTGEEWTRFTPKSMAGLNQVQYDGEALKSDRAYELRYVSKKDFKTVLPPIQRFQISNDVDRANINALLSAKSLGTSQDSVLEQVNILLKNNLPNDAHALLLQQTSPNAELKAAIAAYPNPCIEPSNPQKP